MSLSGDRIKECRLEHKMTQEEVAKILGVGKQAVYKYEAGTVTNIPLENLSAMASLFHVNPGYLAGWSDTKDFDLDIQHYDDLSICEMNLVRKYRQLNPEGQSFVNDSIDFAETRYGKKDSLSQNIG